MKKITIKDKHGKLLSDDNFCETDEQVQDFIRINKEHKVFGKDERWVREKEESGIVEEGNYFCYYPDEVYEEVDVLETETRAVSGASISGNVEVINVVDTNYVKLRADYTIEILDYKRVPKSVTKRQAKQALLQANLLDIVETYIINASRSVQIDWYDSQDIQRDWSSLETIASDLELTKEQIDDLFILAETL
jgi:hypothetical protein